VQGYPRADVDLYKVRTLRQEHIRLQNDAKALFKELAEAVNAVHESAARAGTASAGSAQRSDAADMTRASRAASAHAPQGGTGTFNVAQPFATVTSVAAASPAVEAGLQQGDQICRFGDVVAAPGAVQAVAARLAVRAALQHALAECHAGSRSVIEKESMPAYNYRAAEPFLQQWVARSSKCTFHMACVSCARTAARAPHRAWTRGIQHSSRCASRVTSFGWCRDGVVQRNRCMCFEQAAACSWS
jgi:Nas2 N_terminal domain